MKIPLSGLQLSDEYLDTLRGLGFAGRYRQTSVMRDPSINLFALVTHAKATCLPLCTFQGSTTTLSAGRSEETIRAIGIVVAPATLNPLRPTYRRDLQAASLNFFEQIISVLLRRITQKPMFIAKPVVRRHLRPHVLEQLQQRLVGHMGKRGHLTKNLFPVDPIGDRHNEACHYQASDMQFDRDGTNFFHRAPTGVESDRSRGDAE